MKGPYTEPLYFANKPPDSLQMINSSLDYEDEDEHQDSVEKVIPARKKMKEMADEDEEREAESKRGSVFCPQMLISELNPKRSNHVTTVSELELRKLEQGGDCLSVLPVFFVLNV